VPLRKTTTIMAAISATKTAPTTHSIVSLNFAIATSAEVTPQPPKPTRDNNTTTANHNSLTAPPLAPQLPATFE
jgi:hypothetical protein